MVVARLVLLVLCVSVATSSLVFAQQRGSISGKVLDPDGLALPGATVVVTNTATGFTREAITAETGAYSVPNLEPGTYDVAVTMAGFGNATRTGLLLAAEAEEYLAAHDGAVSVAAVNGPRSVVLAGTPDALDALHAEFTARDVRGGALRRRRHDLGETVGRPQRPVRRQDARRHRHPAPGPLPRVGEVRRPGDPVGLRQLRGRAVRPNPGPQRAAQRFRLFRRQRAVEQDPVVPIAG